MFTVSIRTTPNTLTRLHFAPSQATQLIAHCDSEQGPSRFAHSTHLTCPAPDVRYPPSWYKSTPTAISLIEVHPRIYSTLAPGAWLNDQVVDSYLTLIHWRQSTFRLLPSGRVPVFVHSSQVSPAIETRYLQREASPVPMGTWFVAVSLFFPLALSFNNRCNSD